MFIWLICVFSCSDRFEIISRWVCNVFYFLLLLYLLNVWNEKLCKCLLYKRMTFLTFMYLLRYHVIKWWCKCISYAIRADCFPRSARRQKRIGRLGNEALAGHDQQAAPNARPVAPAEARVNRPTPRTHKPHTHTQPPKYPKVTPSKDENKKQQLDIRTWNHKHITSKQTHTNTHKQHTHVKVSIIWLYIYMCLVHSALRYEYHLHLHSSKHIYMPIYFYDCYIYIFMCKIKPNHSHPHHMIPFRSPLAGGRHK